MLATSSWEEVRGFFSIWQGMRLLLAAVIVGSLYLQAMTQYADKENRSHNVFYSVADLMGINGPGGPPAQSFAAAGFVLDTKTPVIGGGILVLRGG